MSQSLNCDYEQFKNAIKPLIRTYDLEETEKLSSVIHECYERLKNTNCNDKKNINVLLAQLIRSLTNNEAFTENTNIIKDICKQIGADFSEIQTELLSHRNMIDELRRDNDGLRKDIQQVHREIEHVQNENHSVKDRMDLLECFNYCFDLSRLFIYYYIEPTLKKLNEYKDQFNTWTRFKEKVTILKRQIKTDQQNDDELQHFVQPLQNQLDSVGVDVIQLHDLIQNRNTLNHSSIRSTEEQQEYLDYLFEYEFSTKFLHRDLAKTMITLLKQTRLKRYVK